MTKYALLNENGMVVRIIDATNELPNPPPRLVLLGDYIPAVGEYWNGEEFTTFASATVATMAEVATVADTDPEDIFSTLYNTYEIARGVDYDHKLEYDLRDMEDGIAALQTGKADAAHTHTEYAAASHTHEYAATNHTHSDYATTEALAGKADTNHTHSNYAATDHTHSDYASASHTHTGFAAENHTHSEYAATSHTHNASAISGLAGVATSGSYNDLTDKPTIPTSLPANGGNADTVDGKNASDFATATHNHDTAYAAISHTHAQSEITGLATALSGKADASHTHSNYALATDVEELSETVADKANATHTHAQSEITGLTTALAGKASTSHTHSDYATATALSTLEDTVEGKANASHTHAQSEITGLTTALSGKASTSHTHSDYATNTALNELSEVVEGKANASHTHTLDNVTDTTSYVKMTPAERTKLSGIAAGANAYTHPDTHPASMISGLATVATSGSYNDLSDKPATMTPAAHTHAQGDITGLATALSGKADATHNHDADYADISHTHTAAQVGASTSDHTHTAEALIAMASALFGTNSVGGVEYSYGSGSGKNVLTEISNMPQGFHTIYAIAGTTGNPETTESFRYYLHKTSSTIGWILAFGADGSIYSNYQSAAGTFKGWRTIHDVKRKTLWTGGRYMTADHTITPSKKLSECEHGWMLLWSDYDPDTSTINDTDFCTTMIPNRNWAGGTWNGAAYYCDCPRYTAGTATDSESRVIKVLNVYDNKLVGSDNNKAAPRNDVVLRAVYEF